MPESQDIGPTLFNAYGFVGNGLVHCCLTAVLLLLLLESSDLSGLRWQWQGTLAAFDIMIVQILARNAIWLLGIAVGPPCWCAIGMTTSFLWGTVAFGDRPRSIAASTLGLACLVLGVGLVSRASVLSQQGQTPAPADATEEQHSHLAETVGVPCTEDDPGAVAGDAAADAEEEEPPCDEKMDRCLSLDQGFLEDPDAPPKVAAAHPLAAGLLCGLAWAAGAGVADGSLTAFYQQLEGARDDPHRTDDGATMAFASYFGSFGVSMLAIGLLLSATVILAQRRHEARAGGKTQSRCCIGSILPGMASGAMWAGANACSVLASHFLGMALSFPLTQTAVIFCGILGISVFDELRGARSRQVFCAALLFIGLGAGVLGGFGRPA